MVVKTAAIYLIAVIAAIGLVALFKLRGCSCGTGGAACIDREKIVREIKTLRATTESDFAAGCGGSERVPDNPIKS